MKITENTLVTLDYQLHVKTEDGSMELMEETTEQQPLEYFHGMGMMLPKFEEFLEGKAAGDKFEFMITCEDAYGEASEENIIDLPRNVFEQDGELDTERIFEGAIVPLVDNEGQRINAEIVSIQEDVITVDLNHPLAGEDLYFSGKIREVTTPTEEELQAMMSGGCGGGCSCGSSDEMGESGCNGCSGGC